MAAQKLFLSEHKPFFELTFSYLSTNFSLGLTFVSLIRKDCTCRVTQRDEQSNKLLNQNSQMEESQMQWFLVIQCWFWRIYVQFCWLEDYAITMIFSHLLSSGSPRFCVPFFIFVLKLWSTRVLGPDRKNSPKVLINWNLKIQKFTFNKLTMSRRKAKSPKIYAMKAKIGRLLVITQYGKWGFFLHILPNKVSFTQKKKI